MTKIETQKAVDYVASEYQHMLLQATIKALGGNIVDISQLDAPMDLKRNYYDEPSQDPFVRDPWIILDDKEIILTSNDLLKKPKIAALTHYLATESGYEVIAIDHFPQGGNCFYLPGQPGILLRGVESVQKKEQKDCDDTMTRELAKYNILVKDIQLPDYCKNYYYHLDCFIQLLPDGKLLVLNKDMLTKADYAMLLDIFKEDLIDIGYNWFMHRPIYFNFVPVTSNNQTLYVAPILPPSVRVRLETLSLKVITPFSLDLEETEGDPVLCIKVAKELEKMGFINVNHTQLRNSVPYKNSGYRTIDPKLVYSKELRGKIDKYHMYVDKSKCDHAKNFDRYIKLNKNEYCNFKISDGASRCLTNSIFFRLKPPFCEGAARIAEALRDRPLSPLTFKL